MTTTKSKPTAVADQLDLPTLAKRIGSLHRDIETGIEATAVRCVEMHGLLTQARETVGHGKWLQWVADHEKVLGFGERQVQRYLRESDVRTSDLEKEATRQKERRATKKFVDIADGLPSNEPEPELTLEQIEAEGTKKIIAELRRYVGFLERRPTVTPEQIKSLCDVRDQINAVIERARS
jgi:hypothetical protein